LRRMMRNMLSHMSKKVFLTRKPNMRTTIPPGAHGGQRVDGALGGLPHVHVLGRPWTSMSLTPLPAA
jgi:hypothetical protein